MKKTVLSVLTTLPLMFGLVCLNSASINAQEEVELPFVPETEELPPRPFMPENPPAIEVQVDLDAQNYEWKEEKEFFFNVKNEDGSINENFSVVIDPNDEDFDGKGYCRVFLDYGTYTITALDQEELDGYTFINTTYGDENQIAVVQKSLTSNIVPISFTKHYGLKEILEEAKAKKSHKHVMVQQVVQTSVAQVEEVKPEEQTKSSEALPLQAEHKDMKFEKKEVVKKAVTTEHVSTNWNVPVILAGLAGILVCLKKKTFVK